MRITESGVFRSWETLATKSALSRATSLSRHMSRYVMTVPARITTSSTPSAALKSMT